MHAQSQKNSQLLMLVAKISQYYQSYAYQLAVVSRFFAAIVGGYLFTSVFTALMSITLPLKKSDAVLLSISLTIFIYSCVFIWVFAVKSLKTIWITILLTSSACGLSIALLKGWL
ncbi:hypothetical protein NQT69_09670 [Pseudoalteromonas shioyasakiensis]|uniref:hypothetical protein n=1 Tax=Pseudoalteromonas shioyasakiensis TaxID=1190813 RepID=UPI002119AC0E|nr:hypothetical protein [Pseudoalteromonas shioyasakiensis]MCQ8878265.1 hypothetical protein [Pseudoalteromonas shioyasakiensis]